MQNLRSGSGSVLKIVKIQRGENHEVEKET
jgi:hypothetical protein